MSEYCFVEWRNEIVEWGKKYQWGIKFVVFTKAYPFILGLLFSRALANSTLVTVLFDNLREQANQSLRPAVEIVNLFDAVTEVVKVLVSYASQEHFGRFQAVLWLSGSYTFGLLMLWVLEAHNINNVMLYIALFFISLGKAGNDSLELFIKDQLRVKEPCGKVDEERLDRRKDVWCGFPWVLAAIIAASLNASWEAYSILLTIILVVELFGFWLGKPLCAYEFSDTESAWKKIYYVGKAAIRKRHLPYPDATVGLHENSNDRIPLYPNDKFFRWLDKAAVVDHSTNLSVQEQVDMKKLFTVAEVKEVKCILLVVPSSPTLLAYSIVEAAGTTVFFYQANEIDSDFPVIILHIIRKFASYCASIVWRTSYCAPSLWSNNHVKLLNLKIYSGTICSGLSIICFGMVEIYRKHVSEQDHVALSIWWLTPQFIFLGLAEGLLKDGIEGIFKERVSESMGISGTNLVQIMIGIGRLLSFCFVLEGSVIKEENRFMLGYFGFVGATSGVNAFIFGPALYKYYEVVLTNPSPQESISGQGTNAGQNPGSGHGPDNGSKHGTQLVSQKSHSSSESIGTCKQSQCGCDSSKKCGGPFNGDTTQEIYKHCNEDYCSPTPDLSCISYSEGTSYIFPPFTCGTDFHNTPPVTSTPWIVIDDSRPNTWENFHNRAL